MHCPADLISLISLGNWDKMGKGIRVLKITALLDPSHIRCF